MDPAQKLEKYSSAITLSDMEIFIFPDLLYALVLANIMSPRLWAWREHDWFRNMAKMKPYRRVLRLKQFIIDHYEFNLDLDTWGLTTQEQELARFDRWIDRDTLSRSNALFGYEGDKYYFDLDIRRHFGLDKYNTNIIPYWKTETLEAMDAFRHKDNYREGAGECVSLAALYAAALYVVCEIPLDDIFLLATPLHSQNFIDVRDGVLTNNRRVVTHNMWFNGTELTAKAQRALRNEQVTIVSHHTGYIHVLYPEASIQPEAYERFKTKLHHYLQTPINMEIIVNFLRQHRELQTCFQLEHLHHGKPRYIAMENVFHYEHGSPFKVGDNTRDRLLADIDEYEFSQEPIDSRICLNRLSEFLEGHPVHPGDHAAVERLVREFNCQNIKAPEILHDLLDFAAISPRLPGDKQFQADPAIELTPGMTREEVITYLSSIRASNATADLAFYAYRDLSCTEWAPFIKAALERNPVCIEQCRDIPDEKLAETIRQLDEDSIYDGSRLAQPDEVWNYRRGDGVEQAVTLATIWNQRHPEDALELKVNRESVVLTYGSNRFETRSQKNLATAIDLRSSFAS